MEATFLWTNQSVDCRLIDQILKSHSIMNVTPNAIIVITMCTTILIYKSSEFFQIINTNNSSQMWCFVQMHILHSKVLWTFRTIYVHHLHYMYFCIYHVYKSHNSDSLKIWVTHHFLYFIHITFPLCTLAYHEDTSKMDSETKISDISSDCSTQIVPDQTVQCHDMKVHNKISIIKDNIIIELECKGCTSPSGNILCFSSISKPWLDIVEKICSK